MPSSPDAALAYELSIVEDELESTGNRDAIEAFQKIDAMLRRQRAALEDIAGGRREWDLTPSGEHFDFVESFWFLVKTAEEVVGEA